MSVRIPPGKTVVQFSTLGGDKPMSARLKGGCGKSGVQQMGSMKDFQTAMTKVLKELDFARQCMEVGDAFGLKDALRKVAKSLNKIVKIGHKEWFGPERPSILDTMQDPTTSGADLIAEFGDEVWYTVVWQFKDGAFGVYPNPTGSMEKKDVRAEKSFDGLMVNTANWAAED